MFPRQNQNQFRTANADVQIFYGAGYANSAKTQTYSWVKPVGVSHVYMMLIGGGGPGDGSTGATGSGGSGAVTVWYGAAQNVPNNLIIQPSFIGGAGAGGVNSYVYYCGSSASLVTLLTASVGSTGIGGTAMTANQFANSGFFQSVAGQAGIPSGSQTPSATTFLSSGGAGTTTTANYGYSVTGSNSGFFQLQPIIVSVGGSGTTAGADNTIGGIGSGGAYGGVNGGNGGAGMILIASW
jgi:hypothetical protein